MTGNDNSLILQRSRQDNALVDRVGREVLNRMGKEFREGEFAQVVANDERVINGPGVNVPCISISRWPYDEYHTSDDNPSIIHEDKLQEAADMVETLFEFMPPTTYPNEIFAARSFYPGMDYGWIGGRIGL